MDHPGFATFCLAAPLHAALQRLGHTTPTPIQSLAVGPQLEGRDLLASACTGSGKTVAYSLPILHALMTQPLRPCPRTCRGLILAPTRELAAQITTTLRDLSVERKQRILLVTGGAPRQAQIALLKCGVDIVVATPGRLLDLMAAGAVLLERTRHLIIDEADRMLDMGFIAPVRQIAAALPAERQTALFSATLPPAVIQLAACVMRDPLRVAAPPTAAADGPSISARAEIMAPHLKRRRLVEILQGADVARAIVFCRTRRGADLLGQELAAAGIAAGVIHGQRSQAERSRTLGRFRKGRLPVLVTTDLVARGIDVPGVSHVVNFDLPDDADTYVHRIGRTGRAGARGEAITLVAPREIPLLRQIEAATRQPLLPEMCGDCQGALAARQSAHFRSKACCPAHARPPR